MDILPRISKLPASSSSSEPSTPKQPQSVASTASLLASPVMALSAAVSTQSPIMHGDSGTNKTLIVFFAFIIVTLIIAMVWLVSRNDKYYDKYIGWFRGVPPKPSLSPLQQQFLEHSMKNSASMGNYNFPQSNSYIPMVDNSYLPVPLTQPTAASQVTLEELDRVESMLAASEVTNEEVSDSTEDIKIEVIDSNPVKRVEIREDKNEIKTLYEIDLDTEKNLDAALQKLEEQSKNPKEEPETTMKNLIEPDVKNLETFEPFKSIGKYTKNTLAKNNHLDKYDSEESIRSAGFDSDIVIKLCRENNTKTLHKTYIWKYI